MVMIVIANEEATITGDHIIDAFAFGLSNKTHRNSRQFDWLAHTTRSFTIPSDFESTESTASYDFGTKYVNYAVTVRNKKKSKAN